MPADRTIQMLSHGGHQQVGGSGAAHGGGSNDKPNRRRQKHVPRACNNCRDRKRKCDGAAPPCSTCILHQDDKTCAYTGEDGRRHAFAHEIGELQKKFADFVAQADEREQHLLKRITDLESIVRQIAPTLGISTRFLAQPGTLTIPAYTDNNLSPLTPMSSAPPSPYQGPVDSFNNAQQPQPSGDLLAVPQSQYFTRYRSASVSSSDSGHSGHDLQLPSPNTSMPPSPNMVPSLIIQQCVDANSNSPVGEYSAPFGDYPALVSNMTGLDVNAQPSGTIAPQDTNIASYGSPLVSTGDYWGQREAEQYATSPGASGSDSVYHDTDVWAGTFDAMTE